MSLGWTPASFMHWWQGCFVRSSRALVRVSSLARVTVIWMCLGPEQSRATDGARGEGRTGPMH